jgi:DNA-binding transcriptional regulator YdaS (Cro superfamily)
MNTELQKAINHFHWPAALAQAIGVSRQLVHMWQTGERPISQAKAEAIERASGGKIKASRLMKGQK